MRHAGGSQKDWNKSTGEMDKGQTLPALFPVINAGHPVKGPDPVNLAAPLNCKGSLVDRGRSYQAGIEIGRALYAGVVDLNNKVSRS